MIQPLYVHPYPPTDEDRALIKAAKASLDVEFQTILQPAFLVDDDGVYSNMDSKGRALCLRVNPPVLCDSADVADPHDAEALKAAILWCVTDIEDARASSVADKLKEFGYTELTIDDIAYRDISKRLDLENKKVRFR
jgi:hypothetical protein